MNEADAAAGTRLDALVDQVFGVDFTPALQREGRTSAIPQQPFQARAVGAFDAHAGVEREAATVLPTRHRLGVFRLKHTAAGERAQQTPADLGLHFVEQLLVGGTAFVKRRSSRGVRFDDALNDEVVAVHLRIEQRAKAVDEGHRADPGIGARRRAGAAQGLFHDAQENAQRQRLDRGIVVQVITQPHGNRQHPLADRQSRTNVVGQVGGGFDHPPGVASGTDTTALARMHEGAMRKS
jgi:hypothetical protein